MLGFSCGQLKVAKNRREFVSSLRVALQFVSEYLKQLFQAEKCKRLINLKRFTCINNFIAQLHQKSSEPLQGRDRLFHMGRW